MKNKLPLFFVVVTVLVHTVWSHPADPSGLLSNYALFGEEYLNFTEEAETQEKGWIGTNGYLEQGRPWVHINTIAKVKGTFDAGTNDMTTYSDTVYIKGGTKGDLSLVGNLLVADATFPDPVLPEFRADDISVDNSNNFIVKGSQKLEPGQYGRILLSDDNAEVIFSSGIYEIDSLIIRGTVRVPEIQKGVARILVKSLLHFDNAGPNGHRLVADGDALGRVLLFAGGDVIIDQSSRIDAAFVAPESDIELATEIVINGQIHAKSITFRNGFDGKDGTFIPFNPGNLLFPEEVKDGIPEDSLNAPKQDNSYLLSFPLLLSDASEYNATVKYEILAQSSTTQAASEGLDFEHDSNGAIASGTIHFLKGDSVSSDSIHIWIIDDYMHEPIESIEVKLSLPDSLTFENSDSVISYFIPIESEDPEYNELEGSGAALDSVGDGIAHSVKVVLSDMLTESAIVDVQYLWPNSGSEKNIALGDITFLSNKEILFPISSQTGEGSGKGTIVLDDGTTLVVSIVDSVGPVITGGSAKLLDSYSADTLKITVSEPLEDLENNSIPQFIFFDDSSDVQGDTVKALSVTESGTLSYDVILSKGTLTLGDWVQFNCFAETKDLVGNKPASYNQKVQLDITVNKIPSFKSGAIFDTGGNNGRLDGRADSARVEIKLAADTARITMHDLSEVRIDQHNKNVAVTWTALNDSVITIVDPNVNILNSTTPIRLVFETIIVEGELQDSVAPVIEKAQYEAWKSGDTLRVTFSEPLDDFGILEPFHFHSGNKIKVNKQRATAREVTYLVVGGAISESDSIWIKADGEIADSSKVYQQSDNNRRAPLTMLTIISPIEAVFYDTLQKPDAHIDGIRLTFNGTITEEMVPEIRKILQLPGHRGLSYKDNSYTLEGADLFFPLLQDEGAFISTSTDSRDQISFDHTVYIGDTALFLDGALEVADSMGPVVVGAFYKYGAYDETEITVDSVVDTLLIRYSEDVLIPTSETPFGFIRSGGEYTMSIIPGKETGKEVAYARTFRKGMSIPEVGDSLYLKGGGVLSDTTFVDQEKNTLSVQLLSSVYVQPFRFTVFPNPIVLDERSLFVNEYLSYYGDIDPNENVSVLVYPLGIRPVQDTMGIDLVLLDPVGNEILTKEEIAPFRNEKGEWLFTFKLKNSKNRTPGRGSYSLHMTLSGAGQVQHRQLLGVQQAVYPEYIE